MNTGAPSERTRIRRQPKRAVYDRERIDAILDEALICHLGLAVEGQPFVVPTIHARLGDAVYVHGSSASRAIRSLAGGVPACLTATILDGVVLARSAFHHSMNYRSVMVVGEAWRVTDAAEKERALVAISEHVCPGRWDDVRAPNRLELKATSVLRIGLEEASAKVRQGPPGDDDEDLALSCWAGVVPLSLVAGAPVPAPDLREGIAVPGYAASFRPPAS